MGMNETSCTTPPRWLHVIQHVQDRLFAPDFCARHRRRAKDFTRERVLTFPVVMLLLLQKTTKSVQRHLHAFFHQMGLPRRGAVTPGGWTQARARQDHRRLWRGHRLLGCDGSVLRLPSHPEVFEHFGREAVRNHHGATGTEYAPARLSVLYDLLN